jgi:hypothetical protein
MFAKIVSWFHRHPKVKATAVFLGSAAVGGAVDAITRGQNNPKDIGRSAGLAAAAAIYGLYLKRPQDTKPAGEQSK